MLSKIQIDELFNLLIEANEDEITIVFERISKKLSQEDYNDFINHILYG